MPPQLSHCNVIVARVFPGLDLPKLILILLLFSGNYSGWKATCIGNNSSAAVSQLKQEYKEGEMSLNDALDLSVKVILN